MRFQSSLDAIVRLRRLLEERQEAKLQFAQSRLNDCKHSLKQMLRVEGRLADHGSALNEPIPAIDLHVVEMRRRMVGEMVSILRKRLVTLSEVAGAEYGKLMLARREREKVETLRDSAKALWLRQRVRKDQRWLDELFLMRWR
jgi:flagellar export protein FliJ